MFDKKNVLFSLPVGTDLRLRKAVARLLDNEAVFRQFFPPAEETAALLEMPKSLREAEAEWRSGGLVLAEEDYKALLTQLRVPYTSSHPRGTEFMRTYYAHPGFEDLPIKELCTKRRKEIQLWRRTEARLRVPVLTFSDVADKALNEFLTRVENALNAVAQPSASKRSHARKTTRQSSHSEAR